MFKRNGLKLALMSSIVLASACQEAAQNTPSSDDDGSINMGVSVQGLTANQHFCMTWKLFQEPTNGGDAWTLIDERIDPYCAGAGSDTLSDFASCYDARRFLVEYRISFFDGANQVGTAIATSGGGPDDLCAKNTDKNSVAKVQFQNEGTVGGVNPGLEVDQVCSNDKVELENGNIVSALWLQPESCTSGTPDSFCAMAKGDGLSTVRTGITTDGLTRYIFNSAPVDAAWDAWYLSFDPGLSTNTLYLFNSPWVLHHSSDGQNVYGREEATGTLAAWSYDSTEARAVGYAQTLTESGSSKIRIVYDPSAACDSEITRDAQVQELAYPTCPSGTAEPKGAISTGGSTFSLIFACGPGEFAAIACDAQGIGGAICAP